MLPLDLVVKQKRLEREEECAKHQGSTTMGGATVVGGGPLREWFWVLGYGVEDRGGMAQRSGAAQL